MVATNFVCLPFGALQVVYMDELLCLQQLTAAAEKDADEGSEPKQLRCGPWTQNNKLKEAKLHCRAGGNKKGKEKPHEM